MNKPSLTDFMAQPAPAPAKVGKKAQMKHITVRMPHTMHRRVLELTINREIKIQAYITSLIAADFERLGLPID